MKLNSKAEHGLIFMLYLSVNKEKGHISLSEVAKEEDVSLKFLESVVADLRKSNLVEVKRGNRGGYILAESSDKISIKKILLALNDPIFQKSTKREVQTPINKVIEGMWKEINKSIDELFEEKTLGQLVERYEESQLNKMYYI